MHCWYFDKKELLNTPSAKDGIDADTESRYKREGARYIISCGTTLGLRYDTMATGVVYFHRFYMFHSFKDFPRYVTAACCLFLSGKVEETPKKCKDIIKTARALLTDVQFAQFGDDPKEEVMTLERILLQTIKFDLQADHPYAYLLRYAKGFKIVDKAKLQKMVQMGWTFVNDSLCTSLCLHWEPEIIAIALMYLASRLCKLEITDWVGKTSKQVKWWDQYVENLSMELLEDICHEVLDLYSASKNEDPAQSPPRTPPALKRRPSTPPPQLTPGKIIKQDQQQQQQQHMPQESRQSTAGVPPEGAAVAASKALQKVRAIPTHMSTSCPATARQPIAPLTPSGYSKTDGKSAAESYNQFQISQSSMSSYMFGNASYSAQGSENIQSVLAGAAAANGQPPPSSASQYTAPPGPPPSTVSFGYGTYSQQGYAAPSYPPPPAAAPPPGQYYDYSQYQYQPPPSGPPPPAQYQQYAAPMGYPQGPPPGQGQVAAVAPPPAKTGRLNEIKKQKKQSYGNIKRLT
ncbi:PREDICTED: cyclin-K-like [Priapulus caudatus]|uniref:Cyclin-K-like n=1 Tax=Priapulus caudatus TaxID=37621 RepID=A0ABM1EUN1_PRICU|nr:PREDICTED: cyclin-K-like [Priapulus caudatus]XP_014675902.1 PREDICTED: cyclin-K-like [Priapulus caudatus]XP_014675903.1 PREDICTED: cyclin-K-like [Priapulus caudatus]XP_014675904.1 PREDICTED: cyclin-K-like [Priapulus caudatus]XP_014675905.1 PREDICTED: cyclin-K-like [Priapulus caudatus]XP_014675907.1 PREDICTED: cyclin-K-like [Priapulus caudatus]